MGREWEGYPMIRMQARVMLMLFACVATAESPQLSVTPQSGLVDAPLHVAMHNVLPGARVKVTASRPDVSGHTWTAVGEYVADAAGEIDVDASPSLGGTYSGTSSHGLWCSVLPVAPEQLKEYVADLSKH